MEKSLTPVLQSPLHGSSCRGQCSSGIAITIEFCRIKGRFESRVIEIGAADPGSLVGTSYYRAWR